MKHLRIFSLLIALVLLRSAGTALQEKDGFVPLFNGMDLAHWENVNCAPETWTVRDQMIVCTGIPFGILRTEKQYENFILELEWRHMKKGGECRTFHPLGCISGYGETFYALHRMSDHGRQPWRCFCHTGCKPYSGQTRS